MSKPKLIVQNPHKALRAETREIPLEDIRSHKTKALISEMSKTLRETPDGVGLAAPQVGESHRLFIVSEEALEIDRQEAKTGKGGNSAAPERADFPRGSGPEEKPRKSWKHYVFINPVLLNKSRRKIMGPEGCLSVRGKYGEVPRHEKVTVAAYDEHGKKFTRGASRFFARVIQHELDHLEGKLFIDRAEEIFELEPEEVVRK